MGKWVLITSGVLLSCPLLSSWYFCYMNFSITSREQVPTDDHFRPLQRWPCLLPRTTASLVKEVKNTVVLIHYLYQIFWQGGSAILVVSLGAMIPLITLVSGFMFFYLLGACQTDFCLIVIIIPSFIVIPCKKVKCEFVSIL